MRLWTFAILALIFCAPCREIYAQPPHLELVPMLQDRLMAPLDVTPAGDGSGRLFIVEQPGRILVLHPNSRSSTVFLDLTDRVTSGGERGLLGLAFHPNFSDNRRFFVYYTRKPDGAAILEEHQALPDNPNAADSRGKVLLTIAHPNAEHNGGTLQFGPDGYLYISVGDGGPQKDPQNHAQDLNLLLGKILRIDVNDVDSAAGGYRAPPDNPFAGDIPGRDEIYAYGFRNPWKFSFDSLTGQLYVGDVGQDSMEEVDVVEPGGNYGWRVTEGTLCTGFSSEPCDLTKFTLPIVQYVHTGRGGRCAITGGYVYRGSQETLPLGAYVYGDYCTGEIFMLYEGRQQTLLDSSLQITSFGQGEDGELYVVGASVYRIQNMGGPFTTTVPFEFEEGSGISLTTDGVSDEVSVEHAQIQVDSRGQTAALAFIDQRKEGVLISEAAVPASSLIEFGRIHAEIGGNVETGVAIANPDMVQSVKVTCSYVDEDGNDLGESIVIIPPGNQISAFLSQAPFNAPSQFEGSFTFRSTVPVAVIALRGFVNERAEFLTTTIPVADLKTQNAGPVVMPHFAVGAGWTTGITLVNPTDYTIGGSLTFLSSEGAPEDVTIDSEFSSSIPYAVAPRSARQLSVPGSESVAQVGSFRVTPDPDTLAPVVGAIYSYAPAGITVSATGAAAILARSEFSLYAEVSGPPGQISAIQTGLAIANTSDNEAVVDLILNPFDGGTPELTGSLTVPANGQKVAFMSELFGLANLPIPFRGVLKVSSSAPVTVLGVRTRFNERGEFLLSTAAPADESPAAESSESFLPHVVDGGGYTTEIVLFGASGEHPASGDIHFFTQGGEDVNPMAP